MLKALVISVNFPRENNERKNRELKALLKGLSIEMIRFFVQELKEENKKTYIGQGKAIEIAEELKKNDYDLVVTNFDLSPTQYQNLKDLWKREIFDRTTVILQTFSQMAHSKEARLQVEIASIRYFKTRLVQKDANYAQVQSGGGLHARGSGEKQINLDRNHYQILLKRKKKELEEVVKQRKENRRNRAHLPMVAIVGYTNAGKSTLMNLFLDATHVEKEKKVLEEDRLFATLETSTRRISFLNYPTFLLTDTVGFISDLPTFLVEAFRSTLEEIQEADLLLHVVDVSDPNYPTQIRVTCETLNEIGVTDIPMVMLYNKVDQLGHIPFIPKENELLTSFRSQEDVPQMVDLIFTNLKKNWKMYVKKIPFSANFYHYQKMGYIEKSRQEEDGYRVKVYVPSAYQKEWETLEDVEDDFDKVR